MPILLVGQFLQGAGGGGLYALSLGTVAKTYPDRLRPRVMALLATMWILPGLVGPPVGALIAEHGRMALGVRRPDPRAARDLVPDRAGARPRASPRTERAIGLAVRWPLQLMVGAGLVFTSLTVVRRGGCRRCAVGLAIGVPALRHIAPPGTFRARPGMPATAVAAFLLSMAFLAMDAFLTLMLTGVRGVSLGAGEPGDHGRRR